MATIDFRLANNLKFQMEVKEMTQQEEMVSWESERLFDRFMKDIIYDAHSVPARASRSWAGKEIRRRGANILVAVAGFLEKEKYYNGSPDLQYAWGLLLAWMEREIDIQRAGPPMIPDIEGWAKWAREFGSQG